MKTLRRSKILLLSILSLCLLKLYHINAPVGGPNAWRQTNTASVALAMYEEEYNPFYPRIAWRRDHPTGYHESEFPIYNFLAATLYFLLGYSDTWGKVLSWFFHLASVFCIYQLALLIWPYRFRAQMCALLFALWPLNAYYARAFMPESMMIFATIIAILFFLPWIASDLSRNRYYAGAVFFSALAILIKLTSLYLGILYLWLLIRRYGRKIWFRWIFYEYGLWILVPCALWYSHAYRLGVESGLTLGIFSGDKMLTRELLFRGHFYRKVFLIWLAERHLTIAGAVLTALSLYFLYTRKRPVMIHGALIRDTDFFTGYFTALIIYIFAAQKGVYVHEYYMLPWLVPLSLLGGYGLSLLRYRWHRYGRNALLLGIIVMSALRYGVYIQKEADSEVVQSLQNTVKDTPAQSLFLIWDGQRPQLFHYLHRKGWRINPVILSEKDIQDMYGRGLRYAFLRPDRIHPDIASLFCVVRTFSARKPNRWNGYTLYRIVPTGRCD